MKFFAVILSFFFLMLTLLPCEDGSKVDENSSAEETVCFEKDCENESEGLCSPFCQQCHCCQVHVTNLQVTDVVIYNSEISRNIIPQFEGAGEEVLISHFQPPRV